MGLFGIKDGRLPRLSHAWWCSWKCEPKSREDAVSVCVLASRERNETNVTNEKDGQHGRAAASWASRTDGRERGRDETRRAAGDASIDAVLHTVRDRYLAQQGEGRIEIQIGPIRMHDTCDIIHTIHMLRGHVSDPL